MYTVFLALIFLGVAVAFFVMVGMAFGGDRKKTDEPPPPDSPPGEK